VDLTNAKLDVKKKLSIAIVHTGVAASGLECMLFAALNALLIKREKSVLTGERNIFVNVLEKGCGTHKRVSKPFERKLFDMKFLVTCLTSNIYRAAYIGCSTYIKVTRARNPGMYIAQNVHCEKRILNSDATSHIILI